jgi:hypothetical protein
MEEEVDLKGKPGTALARAIPKWALNGKGGCSCKDWEAKMNRWGTEACNTVNRPAIIEHLLQQDDHLVPMLKSLPAFAKRVAANKLLDKAIKMSR